MCIRFEAWTVVMCAVMYRCFLEARILLVMSSISAVNGRSEGKAAPFENVIATSLSRLGPVFAIAKPGTGQPDLGAARDSIVTQDWLGAVKAYMGEALLVAVVIGSSRWAG